ncbi:MAG: quinolinate synthase NadA [Elusimicrobia bacterium]|nr:quinolinate synthase NadA [Elusimicrobiota bacterium]
MTDIIERIQTLAKKRNAVILAHNYQRDEVQDIADFVGDSLELSRKAADTTADVIVFCGVHFMAETAAILNPGKTVILPDAASGCPMAAMIDASQLRALKAAHPGAPVVAYVNTTAEVKAETDICCTSSNAVKIVGGMPDAEIIFVPDKNLGDYVARQTGKNLIFFEGFCPTHMKIMPDDIRALKQAHPNAEVLVHPECRPEAVALADKVLSTTGICVHVSQSPAKEFIIGTEVGIFHRLRKENPEKIFYPASPAAVCPNMKKNSLEKILWALEDMRPVITVAEPIRLKAKRAIDRMLELSK